MSQSTILIAATEESLAAALAQGLADADVEPFARSLLPDVIVVGEQASDAELLKMARQLRGRLADQHVSMLAFLSSAVDSGGTAEQGWDGQARLDLVVEGLRGWLADARSIRLQCDRVAVDDLWIDRRRHAAMLDGREIPLTPTEFRLLWTLACGAGHVFSREQLSSVCRQHDLAAQPRTIDVHVKSIRRKLAHRGELIETVRGLGYRFRPTPPTVVGDTPVAGRLRPGFPARTRTG
jgi:two-component system phosphate regulon response regulator PhoB